MPTFADIILSEDPTRVAAALHHQPEINIIDEYGFTPLIEAAIVNQTSIVQMLLDAGADVHLKDMMGATALHWAAENNNVDMVEALLKKGADPNAWNLSGMPVGVLPWLRSQKTMKKLLEKNGANSGFIKDYINTKMLGHLFEIVGASTILSASRDLVEISFEGFMPEVTIAMIANSLSEFQNHFAARSVRRYAGVSSVITEVLHRAARLIRFQQYRVNILEHQAEIKKLLHEDPLVIPVCYEGHAITFIRFKEFMVKCDRREESRLYDNIVVYRINRPERFNNAFIQKMIYKKQSDASINKLLPEFLELIPLTEIKIPSQVSGNCSWANVEACIPALFYLLQMSAGQKQDKIVKQQALAFFNEWREWNRNMSLQFCLKRFRAAGPLRKATLAETLGAILFQACNTGMARENERAERIILALAESDYAYVLKSYARIRSFEDPSPQGKQFIRLLRQYGFDPMN